MRRWSPPLSLGLLIVLVPVAARPGAATITLDSAETHQVMSGWECTSYVAEPCDPNFDAVRDTILRLAVDDVGINRVRLEARSGSENTTDYYADWIADGCPGAPDPLYYVWRENRYATVNDNGDPDVIDWAGFHFTELDEKIERVILPMRDLVEANGESLHVNLCYVAFTQQITDGEYHHDDPAEYAEFVLAAHLHMQQEYGFVPDTWEILLEPDNVPQWNGTLLGEAIVATEAKLSAAGFTQRFVTPSNASMSAAISYFDGMVAVNGAVDHLQEYSYHRYGGATDENLMAIVERADQYGLDTSMLEWWFNNGTYEVLHKDLTLGRNSAWQGSVLRGLFEIDDNDPDNILVEYVRNTMYNRQYFKFVRSGALRIGAASDDGGFEPTAFINTDGTWVVVVKASGGGDIDIDGLPTGTYGIKYTTGGPTQQPIEYDVDLPDAILGEGEALSTSIPDLGLITIYGRSASRAPRDGFTKAALVTGFPNPAAGSAMILYTIPREGLVQVTIYDVAGRVAHAFAPEEKPSGTYTLRWEREVSPSGVYFYEVLLNGERVGARKLVVAP